MRCKLLIAALIGAVLWTSSSWSQVPRFQHLHQMLPPVLDYTHALALGDVDGDGDLDALIGNASQQTRLYLNDGWGIYVDVTSASLPSTTDITYALALGDVDGDGDLDALIGNASQQNRLYLNDGSGVFSHATAANLPVDSDDTRTLTLGDVDGDGDLDALIGNASQQNRLYLNDGSGSFSDVTTAQLPADADRTCALALGDLDSDGDLDALIGNARAAYPVVGCQQNHLYLNDGLGTFTDSTTASLPVNSEETSALALGDVDGDGDLDAVVGNGSQQNRIYTNITRQLAYRAIPRVGKPLTMDLYGPAGGQWLLMAAATPSSLPLPPLGILRLDPSSLFLIGGGSLDSQGRSSLNLPAPASPFFIGASAYWQALVASPLVLTNLEITTFTDL